jgi:hypothetical protein
LGGAGGQHRPYTAGTPSWSPDAAHDFAGWSGDAGGSANPLAVLMDRAKSVQANFALKSFTLTTSAMRRERRNARAAPIPTARP